MKTNSQKRKKKNLEFLYNCSRKWVSSTAGTPLPKFPTREFNQQYQKQWVNMETAVNGEERWYPEQRDYRPAMCQVQFQSSSITKSKEGGSGNQKAKYLTRTLYRLTAPKSKAVICKMDNSSWSRIIPEMHDCLWMLKINCWNVSY